MTLVGCDLIRESLLKCESKGLYSRLVCVDPESPEQLPFEDKTFDAIACDSVLSYLHKFDRLFSEFFRITKPGGVVIFTHREELWTLDIDNVRTIASNKLWKLRHVSDPQPICSNPPPGAKNRQMRYVIYEI